jgi:hypothetical protein
MKKEDFPLLVLSVVFCIGLFVSAIKLRQGDVWAIIPWGVAVASVIVGFWYIGRTAGSGNTPSTKEKRT